MPPRIAIIGSFRQHYPQVLHALEAFRGAGYEITSPKGDPVILEGISFVRFTSDPKGAPDPMVQTIALHRILSANLVYVVSPGGYVGRTTCYEIGRIIQARRPIFFSESPKDLPILVPEGFLCSPEELVDRLKMGRPLHALFEFAEDDYSRLEWDLSNADYREI